MKGITKSGFVFDINEDCLDDYETLEVLIQANNGDKVALFTAVERLLGAEQKERLKDHLRENGKVRATKMVEEIQEIFEQLTPKNS